jgi:hypothetical protein
LFEFLWVQFFGNALMNLNRMVDTGEQLSFIVTVLGLVNSKPVFNKSDLWMLEEAKTTNIS